MLKIGKAGKGVPVDVITRSKLLIHMGLDNKMYGWTALLPSSEVVVFFRQKNSVS